MKAQTIWKFELTVIGSGFERHSLRLPRGASTRSVQVQGHKVVLWAAVDPEAPLEPRVYTVVGTGVQFSEAEVGRYIGTVQMAGDDESSPDFRYVRHIFEEAI